jgi:hypothetical protein
MPTATSRWRIKRCNALGFKEMKRKTAEVWRKPMMNLFMAALATITFGVGAARAAAHPADSPAPRVSKAYVSNGAFDWRRNRPNWQAPWYAYSESGKCFVWTPNAYHYACDPNARY